MLGAEELAVVIDGRGHLFARPGPRDVFADPREGCCPPCGRERAAMSRRQGCRSS